MARPELRGGAWRVGGFALIAAAAVLTACTSTVNGTGIARQPSLTPTPTTSTAATTPASSSSTPTPTTPAPTAVSPPPQCPGGTCQIAATIGLPNGYEILLRNGTSTTAPMSSVVELTQRGVPVAWFVADGEQPAHIACSITNQQASCVVVNEVGAHGSDAIAFVFTGSALQRGDTVTASTPEMFPRDLNSDGTIDAEGLQNDYTPDYATGKVQWQTWTSNGLHFTSTGCGPKSSVAPTRPATPQTGPC